MQERLYGRILTEVATPDLDAVMSIQTIEVKLSSHTDRLSSVNKMFIVRQSQEEFNSFHVPRVVLTDILLTNGDKPNFILPKFAQKSTFARKVHCTFFFSSALCHLPK